MTRNQLSLLRAVAAGHVAWRRHLRCGWAIRRMDVRSRGAGGALGAQVTGAVQQLARRGLVDVPDRPQVGEDVPIRLTVVGQGVLFEIG